MTKISEVIQFLEEWAPPCYQESFDNSGFLIGNKNSELKKGLVCLDLTQAVMKEAIAGGFNLIISHHPFIFTPLKQITGQTNAQKIAALAIKNDIAVYAVHTNLDNVYNGVNQTIAEKIGLQNCQILSPMANNLKKLVVFVPIEQATTVREALFNAGAGAIGKLYDRCSFNVTGVGTFRPGINAEPFVGEIEQFTVTNEVRLEVVFPQHIENKVISKLLAVHPYQEPAFDIISLSQCNPLIGAGMIGELPNAEKTVEFLQNLKQKMQLEVIKHGYLNKKEVKKVAFCGGSGSFLIPNAVAQKADIFISSELKHNQFLDHRDEIILVDIGHFESEIFIKNAIFSKLIKKFSNFAEALTEKNPVYYL
ncbi:MAG: Nif3-like dinuclear metal center hexameric protein [Bacteroidales bacterium]|jgi:dinuclear metal center YbgI/SA1388 family protein|nr:Nif3-like dinuclear metal center hexameric protein [Bacteroidales bacterium]